MNYYLVDLRTGIMQVFNTHESVKIYMEIQEIPVEDLGIRYKIFKGYDLTVGGEDW